MLLSLGGLAAVAVVGAGVLFLSVGFDARAHPLDQELEANFLKHEADFELLARMAKEDANVVRIAPDFTWLTNNAAWPRPQSALGFTSDRWEAYRTLFSKLDLPAGIVNYQPDTIMFLASTRGLVTGGSAKGYAYSIKDPVPIVESFENVSFKDSRIAYKRLKGHWYLFYEVS
ncbi:MAG TPA: hypothetical protein VGO68_16905 [Pyrinomonadaceae bacterium]|nr:hypothetical protein [Pyrinomonadaceae bacterium]